MTTRRQIFGYLPVLAAGAAATQLAGCVAYPTYTYPYPPPAASVAPEMVWLPSIGMYVALGYNYPLFYSGGVYYYSYGGYWYSGPRYRGPWRRLPAPPPPLVRFQPRYWSGYQAKARGYYHGNPNWQHFRPPGPAPR